MFSPCSEKRRASDKDLPVDQSPNVKERKKNLVFMSLSPLNSAIAACSREACYDKFHLLIRILVDIILLHITHSPNVFLDKF
jgi:hypothetical protein